MESYYKLKTIRESFGTLPLEITCLNELEETIDGFLERLAPDADISVLETQVPYFGVIWPSARALATYLALLDDKAILGKNVLELGCGLAIPSMVAAKRGAKVLATDFHALVPQFLAKNLSLNSPIQIEYQEANWEKDNPSRISVAGSVMDSFLFPSENPLPLFFLQAVVAIKNIINKRWANFCMINPKK